jgi:hypothetical protein
MLSNGRFHRENAVCLSLRGIWHRSRPTQDHVFWVGAQLARDALAGARAPRRPRVGGRESTEYWAWNDRYHAPSTEYFVLCVPSYDNTREQHVPSLYNTILFDCPAKSQEVLSRGGCLGCFLRRRKGRQVPTRQGLAARRRSGQENTCWRLREGAVKCKFRNPVCRVFAAVWPSEATNRG